SGHLHNRRRYTMASTSAALPFLTRAPS
ncbi:hypothetical protein BN1723_020323, partial [Verticillium longisporum]